MNINEKGKNTMYMILFEQIEDTSHVVSAIRRIQDANAAKLEWQRIGDVYSAYILSDVPNWNIRLVTH
jgi:hypothetical protein